MRHDAVQKIVPRELAEYKRGATSRAFFFPFAVDLPPGLRQVLIKDIENQTPKRTTALSSGLQTVGRRVTVELPAKPRAEFASCAQKQPSRAISVQRNRT